MKLETFFEKFEQFADAPNAVVKMRELVLQLAIQGKLLPQDPADGDTDLLISDIAEARTAKGRAKKSDIVPEVLVDDDAQWHKVPPSWRWVRLSFVGDIVGGGTPRSDNIEFFAEEGIPWLTPADLNGYKEKRISRGRRCITPLGLSNSSTQLLPAGSVLFSSRAPIGYVAIAETELATNQGFKSCVPFIIEMSEFIYYFLKSAAARIDREASGTTFREVSGKIVSQIPVPLPPLAEQKRIVAKVDELMSLCDRLEAQQQDRNTLHAALARASLACFADAPTLKNLNLLFHPSCDIAPADIRKTILELAICGKLSVSADDDSSVPSDVEFQRAVVRLSVALGLRAQKEITEDLTSPFEIPCHWRWLSLGDIGVSQTGTTPSKNDHAAFNGDIPFIKPADIFPNNIDYFNESLTRYGAESGSRLAAAGSLLMVCIGTIGKCNLIERECSFNQQINSLTPVEAVDSKFLLLAVRAPYFQDAAWKKSSSTTIAIINKGKWLSIPIPIPPLAEQRRIVAKVDQLMALVDQLETQLATSSTAAVNLMESVVAEMIVQE